MYRTIICLILGTAAYGAIAGDPISVQPTAHPDGWLDYANDNNMPGQPDNNFTAGIELGFRKGDWLIGIAYNLLTNKILTPRTAATISQNAVMINGVAMIYTGTRSDQLSLTVGHMCVEDEHLQISVSGGIRTTGNYGGQGFQDYVHSFLNDIEYQIPYDSHQFRPLAITDIRYKAVFAPYLGMNPALIIGSTGNSIEVNASLPIYITCQSDNKIFKGPYTIWAGPLYQRYWGDSLGFTDHYVNDRYNENAGTFLNAGVQLNSFDFSMYWNKTICYATLGFTW